MNQNDNLNTKNNEIDLINFIIPLWLARKKIFITALIFAMFGGIIGFLIPQTYMASSIFLPQTNQSSGATSSLGGLAALAGVNLNTPMAGGDIPSSMYSTILASEPFRKRILDSKIWINSDSVTFRSYLQNQPGSVLGTINEYTIGLPGKLIRTLTGSEVIKFESDKFGLQPLSDEEYGLHNALAGKINIGNDKKEGFVSLTVVDRNPLVAAQVAKVTEEVLQDWIIEHKVRNTKAQYDFIAKQYEAKQKEFFSIQEKLANYTDQNQNVLAASYLTRLERLQAEFDLVNTIYSDLAKQKEQAAIQMSKDTPTFSILSPVSVPKEKIGPKKSFYFLGFFSIGLICASCWNLFEIPIKEYFKKLQRTY